MNNIQYPVTFFALNTEETYSSIYNYWVNAKTITLRYLERISDEEFNNLTNVRPISETNLKSVTLIKQDNTSQVLQKGDNKYLLVSERTYSLDIPSNKSSYNQLKYILFGLSSKKISIVNNFDDSRGVVSRFFQNTGTYLNYFGLAPLVKMYQYYKDQPLNTCAYDLYAPTRESLITNFPISKYVSQEEMSDFYTTSNNLTTTALYIIPEVESTKVSKEDNINITVSLWSFDNTAELNTQDFGNTVLNTNLNREVILNVSCPGKPTKQFTVNCVEGIGTLSIPGSEYEVGDKLTFTSTLRIPATYAVPTVTII